MSFENTFEENLESAHAFNVQKQLEQAKKCKRGRPKKRGRRRKDSENSESFSNWSTPERIILTNYFKVTWLD